MKLTDLWLSLELGDVLLPSLFSLWDVSYYKLTYSLFPYLKPQTCSARVSVENLVCIFVAIYSVSDFFFYTECNRAPFIVVKFMISLATVLGEVMEQISVKAISEHMKDKKVIVSSQQEFKMDTWCLTSLTALLDVLCCRKERDNGCCILWFLEQPLAQSAIVSSSPN